jgi:hypothetical protein
MREKLEPWIPAVFCAALALITTIGNLFAGPDFGATSVSILFMPVCFYHVGVYLIQLRNENRDMRLRLDAIENPKPTTATNRMT